MCYYNLLDDSSREEITKDDEFGITTFNLIKKYVSNSVSILDYDLVCYYHLMLNRLKYYDCDRKKLALLLTFQKIDSLKLNGKLAHLILLLYSNYFEY